MFQRAQQVQAFNLGFLPRSDVPRPVLLQSEGGCYLLFEGTADAPPRSNGVVIVTFKSCLVSRFGYPNDEALAGHPLFKAGLSFYGVFEVNNSSWDNEIRSQNRVAFPGFNMPKRRHFVVTFHDSMFECIAASAVAVISTDSFSSAVSRVVEALPNDV
jgi:hypothetical protein